MGFKEILQKITGSNSERKEMIRQIDQEIRLRKLVEDRQKSSNERELERFMREEREDQIKESLDVMRKKRQRDISFGHNPLNTPNITNHVDWEVLKEKNMFNNKSTLFKNDGSVLKNNPNLLKSGSVL